MLPRPPTGGRHAPAPPWSSRSRTRRRWSRGADAADAGSPSTWASDGLEALSGCANRRSLIFCIEDAAADGTSVYRDSRQSTRHGRRYSSSPRCGRTDADASSTNGCRGSPAVSPQSLLRVAGECCVAENHRALRWRARGEAWKHAPRLYLLRLASALTPAAVPEARGGDPLAIVTAAPRPVAGAVPPSPS